MILSKNIYLKSIMLFILNDVTIISKHASVFGKIVFHVTRYNLCILKLNKSSIGSF
jgi:hypothetical protein